MTTKKRTRWIRLGDIADEHGATMNMVIYAIGWISFLGGDPTRKMIDSLERGSLVDEATARRIANRIKIG